MPTLREFPVRFEVSKVLDAIEARLTTDPALARAVVDLAEVVRYADLDGGRPASMLRRRTSRFTRWSRAACSPTPT
jgi:hypothetical protein